jgi:hypothetical protein
MSVDMLKQRTGIHSNTDAKIVYPEIKAAEDLYIEPILGTALYDKIISDINVSGTPLGADYVTLVDRYILDTLQNFTLSTLCLVASFQIWNKGLLRKTGEDTEAPTMSDLVDISNFYKNRAEIYANRLKNYLRAVSTSSVLPEYLQPGSRCDTILPANSTFTIPIYLGGDDTDNCFQLPLTPKV